MQISKERFFVSNAKALSVHFREDVPTGHEFLHTYYSSLQRLILSKFGLDLEDSIDIIYNGNIITFQFIEGTSEVGVRDFRGFLMVGSDILYIPDEEMINEINEKDLFGERDFEVGNSFTLNESPVIDDIDGSISYLILTYVNGEAPEDIYVVHDPEGDEVAEKVAEEEVE